MPNIPKVLLSGCGVEMPMIGLGTFTVRGTDLIYSVVEAALRSGYRAIDTAEVYRNEKDIGLALIKLLPKYNLRREDIFLTSKLAPGDLGTGKTRSALISSLSNLNVKYLDLYLIHWPGASGRGKDAAKLRVETWLELQKCQKEGLVRAIGVSNFLERHLEQLPGTAPSVNQVELHPHYPQKELLEYCKSRGIHVQAYSSLGGNSSQVLLKDPTVISVAKKTGRSVPQVLLRWALQQGIGVIPKSVNPERIAANIALDFQLSADDMNALSSLKFKRKYAWDPITVD